MSTIRGIARKIDHLGRIVVPVELRRALGVRAGDALDATLEGSTIQLRKLEASCVFCQATEDLASHRDKLVCARCRAELGKDGSG